MTARKLAEIEAQKPSLVDSVRFYISKAVYGLSLWIEPPSIRHVFGDMRPYAQEIWDRTKAGERSGKITLDWNWPSDMEPPSVRKDAVLHKSLPQKEN